MIWVYIRVIMCVCRFECASVSGSNCRSHVSEGDKS